jgi:hypothetical protein
LIGRLYTRCQTIMKPAFDHSSGCQHDEFGWADSRRQSVGKLYTPIPTERARIRQFLIPRRNPLSGYFTLLAESAWDCPNLRPVFSIND